MEQLNIDSLLEKIKDPEKLDETVKHYADKVTTFLDKFNDMSTEERDKIFGKLFDEIKTKRNNIIYGYITFYGAILLVLLVFLFFGYKLYKSLVDKEKRKEEKKKLKLQKKKK